ncbi:MAG: hypothetical protein LBE22_10030 [Azoarcus sp.]|jgi:hypothetical protein|nr:hypothetical protein [Azoarcus sp.]
MKHLLTFTSCLLVFALAACQSTQTTTNLADPGHGLTEPVPDAVDFHDRFNPSIVISRTVMIYEGEIESVGKVVMELKLSPKKPGLLSGRYFFARNGYDIPLEGTMDKLVEPKPVKTARGAPQYEGFDKPRAIWNIRQRTGCCLKGEWIDQHTGKAHRFELKDVYLKGQAQSLGFEVDDHGNNLPDPYRFLQIKAIAKPVDEETVKGQVAYRMWEDPRTGVQYPRLTRHPDPKVMARINFLLEEKHGRFATEMLWAQSGDDQECANAVGNARVEYLTPTLMTIIESGTLLFCMSDFYPYVHPVTFDLVRGEYLNWNRLSNLFVAGKDENGTRPVPSPAFREWVNRLKQEDSKTFSGEKDEYGCSLDAEKFWDVYFVESDSLAINGVSRCCSPCGGESVVLPFSRLKPILKPEGLRYLFPEHAPKQN